ncbi:MAG: hypothetical protein COB78_04010 [Hyphomicrobiales bacterium]|nr:MAG: hypothetical protein COB78_04010 [Hyphomicrobiales bacterium]
MVARRAVFETSVQVVSDSIEIDRSDIPRIELLLSEIREIVRKSSVLDEEHQLRLLKIVSDLQREIDKPISSYRAFLDGLIETSDALGTSGKKMKPAFDRMREIFGIIDNVKKQAEQIGGPEEIKQLPAPKSKVDE